MPGTLIPGCLALSVSDLPRSRTAHQKIVAIPIVSEYLLTHYPPDYNMVQNTGSLARHGLNAFRHIRE
jgi:hypothetical protein